MKTRRLYKDLCPGYSVEIRGQSDLRCRFPQVAGIGHVDSAYPNNAEIEPFQTFPFGQHRIWPAEIDFYIVAQVLTRRKPDYRKSFSGDGFRQCRVIVYLECRVGMLFLPPRQTLRLRLRLTLVAVVRSDVLSQGKVKTKC